jgi:excisionase family DNA binding protein
VSTTLPRLSPNLITTTEAADLLHVSPRTVLNWIEADAIPYIQLPSAGTRREYRIPVAALLRSLSGNYDLAADLAALDQRTREANISDEDVLAVLEEEDS